MKLRNAHLAYTERSLGSNLDLVSGKIVLILGDSGCGKTSLLKAIAGFTDLAEGEILSDHERVAMLLQNPFHQIIMQKVHDELYFPLKNGGIEGEDAEKIINGILEKLQISHLRARDISTLSFGETQLVMIAATCLTPAEVLLLDEPTSHLDPPYIKQFYSLIRELADRGKSICITSQSPDEYIFADEVWVMDKGSIKAICPADKCPGAMKEAGIELDIDHINEKLEGLKK